MLKKDELTDPTSCLSKAHDNERVFVLLARDVTAPATIRFWCQERMRLGKNTIDDSQIQEAFECARLMEEFQQRKVTAGQRWSTAVPTQEGWYGWKAESFYFGVRCVEIVRDFFTNELRVSGDEALLKGLAFKDIPGEWCGPIEFPADITSNEEAS